MKVDIIVFIVFILFGALAGDFFLSAVSKVVKRDQDVLIKKIDESLDIQRDLKEKLNYKTGDVAAQLARMDNSLVAMEKRLQIIENALAGKK